MAIVEPMITIPFDEAAPHGSKPSDLRLDTIPEIRALPSPQGEKANFHSDRNHELHTYNPSVVAIPPSWRHKLNATYVAMIRASNHNNCVHNPTSVPKTHVELTGFILLDSNLQKIQRREVVVRTPLEDCRLKAQDGNFLFWCKKQVMIVNFSLTDTRLLHLNCDKPLWCGSKKGVVLGKIKPDTTGFDVIAQTGLQINSLESCTLDIEGKNFNFFEVNHQKYLEIWPMNPSGKLSFLDSQKGSNKLRHDVVTIDSLPCGHKHNRHHFGTTEVATLPNGNRHLGEPRGGACCIMFPATKHGAPDLFVGIGHYKQPKMQYTAFLYAFESKEPFKVVGMSDPFCWPDITQSNDSLLSINETQYPCPHIEMTMSMEPKIDDGDMLIIGYGINDCASHFVQVPKNALIDRIQWF